MICKHCGVPIRVNHPRRSFCSDECHRANRAKLRRLKYRNDEAYREAIKTDNLNRYRRSHQ